MPKVIKKLSEKLQVILNSGLQSGWCGIVFYQCATIWGKNQGSQSLRSFKSRRDSFVFKSSNIFLDNI